MRKIPFISKLLVILLLGLLASLTGAEDELSDTQKSLVAEIEHNLVAPCCWNMTVDQHDSPLAREVREEVAAMVKQGKGSKDILAYFASPEKYGERILATPSQDNLLGKLAYWLIPAAFLFGGSVVFLTVRRLMRHPANRHKVAKKQPASPDSKTDSNKYWQERVEKELSELD
jgi:cytochrome c-type biogenesis protein CcmH